MQYIEHHCCFDQSRFSDSTIFWGTSQARGVSSPCAEHMDWFLLGGMQECVHHVKVRVAVDYHRCINIHPGQQVPKFHIHFKWEKKADILTAGHHAPKSTWAIKPTNPACQVHLRKRASSPGSMAGEKLVCKMLNSILTRISIIYIHIF